MRRHRAAPQKTFFKSGHVLSLCAVAALRPVLLIEMVNRAYQPGIVAVAYGVDIFRNAKLCQMFSSSARKPGRSTIPPPIKIVCGSNKLTRL